MNKLEQWIKSANDFTMYGKKLPLLTAVQTPETGRYLYSANIHVLEDLSGDLHEKAAIFHVNSMRVPAPITPEDWATLTRPELVAALRAVESGAWLKVEPKVEPKVEHKVEPKAEPKAEPKETAAPKKRSATK